MWLSYGLFWNIVMGMLLYLKQGHADTQKNTPSAPYYMSKSAKWVRIGISWDSVVTR